MKKIWLLFLFLLLSSASSVRATGYEGSPNQNWQCLEAKKIDVHTVSLSAKISNQFPPPLTDVYIVECISTDAGNKCTTGQDNVDRFLFNNTNDLLYLRSNYKYNLVKFSGTQPLKSTMDGKIPSVAWESEIQQNAGHTFFGVSILPEIPIGDQYFPGQKLGTFYFINASEQCSSLRWDPYGRVFDSKSLEPIKNVSVTLFEKTGGATKKVSLPGVTNPQYTLDDGMFSFVVPDGTYTLSPSINTHAFPNSPTLLHPNSAKAYSDIYRGEDIIQRGAIQHRDIPVDPVGTSYRAPVKIMDYSIILNKVYAKYEISGELSHPLSVVKVYSGSKYITQVTADKFGKFDITINSADVDSAEDLLLMPIKTDLTSAGSLTHLDISYPSYGLQPEGAAKRIRGVCTGTNLSCFSIPAILSKLVPPAFAQSASTSIKLPAILNNIEGYAIDAAGRPVGNATVNIYLVSSQKIYTQTKANAAGYFKFPSQYLPPLPYVIEVRSPNGTSRLFTAKEFSLINKQFIAEKKINYGTYKPLPETPNLTPGVKPTGIGEDTSLTPGAGGTASGEPSIAPGEISDDNLLPPGNVTLTPEPPAELAAAKNIALTLLLLLLTGGAIGVAYYVYKKKQTAK